MKLGDVFPSKYLKAGDLPKNQEVSVVIDRVALEVIGDDEDKPVLYFKGSEKGLVLNRTNWGAIEMSSGIDDTDNWRGIELLLYQTTTQFGGNTVPCIRLRMVPKPAAPAAPAAPPADAEGGYDTTATPAADIFAK